MYYTYHTQKTCTGKTAAIVRDPCRDNRQIHYSLHPDRSAAFFHAKKMARTLYKRDNTAFRQRIRAALEGLRSLPGWPVGKGGWA